MSRLSRRHFLQSTAAAAATFAIARNTGAQANELVRVGVIGCRNRGPQVAEAMLGAGGFEIAALADCDTRMLEQGYRSLRRKLENKPKMEQDFRRLLEDPDIDAIVVATPDYWHAAMAILALDAGKHVYLEKPATYNIEEGRAILKKHTDRPQLTMCMGTQQRSGPHFKEAAAFVHEGNLGKVAFCRTWITHTRDIVPKVPDSEPPAELDYEMWVGPAPYRPYNEETTHYNWHFIKPWGTGEMGNWGAHWIDIARWYLKLDYPTAVSGAGGTYVTHDAKEWPDTQTVMYEFPELTLLWEQRLWTKYGLNDMGGGVELDGDKGSLVINRGGWTFYPREGEPERREGSEQMLPHVSNFAQAIKGLEAPAAPMEEGHKTATMCHLGNITGTLNRRVTFDGEKGITNDEEAANLLRREYREPWTGLV
jgi:predicted dehydrogenase